VQYLDFLQLVPVLIRVTRFCDLQRNATNAVSIRSDEGRNVVAIDGLTAVHAEHPRYGSVHEIAPGRHDPAQRPLQQGFRNLLQGGTYPRLWY
jgi:hypothetical protein